MNVMEDKDSFRKAVIVVVFSALIAVVGFLTEIPAVTAGGLFMTYICCSRLLFGNIDFEGACALVILVLSSAETLSGIGTLLLLSTERLFPLPALGPLLSFSCVWWSVKSFENRKNSEPA